MIQEILSTLFNVIVPLVIPVISGVFLTKFKKLEIRPILNFVLYFFTPFLIFDTLMEAEVSGEDVYLTLAYSLLSLLLLWAASNLFGKLFKLPSNDIAGLTLISAFTNSVNYGIPLILLAFGQSGLEKASIFIVLQMIMMNTLGVYFAARSHFTVKNALKSVFSLPAIYAAMLAILFRAFHLSLPEGVFTGVSMIADAYPPIVLAILGAQIANVRTGSTDKNIQITFWIGMGIRLFIGPLISLFCLYLLDIDGIMFSVLFVLACMPVAINAGILAEKFDASPKVLTQTILWTTLLSFIVLPVLIVLVK
ncbi:permease [Bacillus sp. SA1-12]|uniref:AEC family transporter n=1 Tax=Bacillus sp. SA1-12 TaxID=1455638 RepID=UPI0006272C7C|nr:AEC family transporter [Bacillus sp. SA1-12]KKI90724.1 permease [Bacillus sp. SA1-12]